MHLPFAHWRGTTLPVLAALILTGTCSFACRMRAQDSTPAPSPPTTTTSDSENTSNLIPGGGTPAPELEENSAAHRGGGGGGGGGGGAGRHSHMFGGGGRPTDLLSRQAANDPISVRIAFRKAKTTVLLRHPELSTLEKQAATAPTEVDKRNYLRAYYTQLYAEVKKVDPSPEMASHVDTLSQIAQQRYDPKRRAVGGEEGLVRRGGRGGRGRRR